MRAVGRRSHSATALAVFVLLAVVHTWPLATNPAHLSRNDNADTLLNSWTLAWVAHQLPRDPRHLFDANIFYPNRLTLAYSEAMIVQGILAMPVLALGGSPVLAYNLVLIAGFVLTGWAFFLLMWRWTGDLAASYVAGSAAGFNSHVLVELPHLQFQHLEFVALVLFAVDAIVVSRRVRDGVLLGAGFALQGLTSVYLLMFTTWMTGFAALTRLVTSLRREYLARTIALFAIAAVVAAVLLGPYVYAYYELHRITGMERGPEEAAGAAGSWVDYLYTGSRFHYALWSARFDSIARSTSFPGIVVAVLAVLALVFPDSRRDARVQMCAWTAVGCAAVSMLPRAPFYPALHKRIILFQAVRVPAHMGHHVLLLLAVLAGFAVAALARRYRTMRGWTASAIALVMLVNAEALRAPIEYREFTSIPNVYDALRPLRGAVIAELPLAQPVSIFANAEYMLNSTRHWRPMVNGYSGFRPDAYDDIYRDLLNFPDETSLIALHRLGVTHVVVHTDRYEPARVDAMERSPSLAPIAAEGPIRIYRLR